MTTDKQTRQIIVRLLGNFGSQKEIQQYLRRFSSIESEKFAVVKVGGATLHKQLGGLSSSLAFLQQVGLTPIVVHGGGPQLDLALEAEGIETERADGLRVTPPAVLKIARKVFQRENLRLVEALRETGTRATSITNGVFEAELLDRDRLGLVGAVRQVHLEAVRASLRSNIIPVISPFGETADGQILNINADVATNELVRSVQPFKIIFLTGTGGILDREGGVISSINLSTDYKMLMEQDWLHSGMRLKLEQIHDLLKDLPLSTSISITKPTLLAKELFTYRGSGTLVRFGESIHMHRNWDEVDLGRLKQLLETSFQKTLSQDYFANAAVEAVYISDSYRAGAVITRIGEVAYLDKFAVTEEAQGEGLGRAVWNRFREDYPSIFWRARPNNPVNTFYFQHADGCIKGDEWHVFWCGIDDFGQISQCVDTAMRARATLR